MCEVQLWACAWFKKIATMLFLHSCNATNMHTISNIHFFYLGKYESYHEVVFCSKVVLEDHRFNLYR